MGYGLAGIFRKILVWPGTSFLLHLTLHVLKECSCYDLAYYFDQHRSVLWSPRSVKDRPGEVQWLEYLPLQILLYCLPLFLLLVLVPWIHRPFPQRLRIRSLDSPQQCCGKPAVRRMDWSLATANHL